MGNVSMFFNELKQQIESSGIIFRTKIDIKQVRSFKGSQEYEFIGTINIETNLKDIQNEFPFETDKEKNKDNANKNCQFHVLKILKQYKYLDCHLKFCKNKAK